VAPPLAPHRPTLLPPPWRRAARAPAPRRPPRVAFADSASPRAPCLAAAARPPRIRPAAAARGSSARRRGGAEGACVRHGRRGAIHAMEEEGGGGRAGGPAPPSPWPPWEVAAWIAPFAGLLATPPRPSGAPFPPLLPRRLRGARRRSGSPGGRHGRGLALQWPRAPPPRGGRGEGGRRAAGG